MTEKMHYELREIPTQQQKQAVVTEVVQSIVKTASVMIGELSVPAWNDLGEAKLRKSVTLFSQAVEDAGLLLPEAVREYQEVTISSNNIRKFDFFDFLKFGFFQT